MNRYADKSTMRGYALACANLVNIYDRADMAVALLQEAEIDIHDLPKLDLDSYSYRALYEVLRDMGSFKRCHMSELLEKSIREDEARQ